MATIAELLRNSNPNQTNEDGNIFLGDENSGRWISPTEYSSLQNMESAVPNATYLTSGMNADNQTTAMYQLPDGGLLSYDVTTNQPISYEPPMSWYDEQLKARPDALRGTDYRNQTYLASGPLPQTYNFNGTEVPMTLAEWQVDPKTGGFAKGPTGENMAVAWRPKEEGFIDKYGPYMPLALPALVAAGAYAAPYLAAEGAALGAGEAAGGFGLNAAGTGATFGSISAPTAGYTFGGLSASQVPTLTAGLELGAGGGAAAFGAKDAYNTYKTANALKSLLGGGQAAQQGGYSTGSSGGNWNYQNQPFLKASQQSSVYAPTGLNVSGIASPDLDVSRNSNLLANLLRR